MGLFSVWLGRSTLFRALLAGLATEKFLLLREAIDERRCCVEDGVGTLAEAAAAYLPDPKCPVCGVWRNGSTAGVPMWRCRCCGWGFTSIREAVLER